MPRAFVFCEGLESIPEGEDMCLRVRDVSCFKRQSWWGRDEAEIDLSTHGYKKSESHDVCRHSTACIGKERAIVKDNFESAV